MRACEAGHTGGAEQGSIQTQSLNTGDSIWLDTHKPFEDSPYFTLPSINGAFEAEW